MADPTHLLTVLTSDRRGIIAAISSTLAALEVELLELTQTVVCGYFTVTLVLALPASSEPQASLADRIVERLGERLGAGAAVTLVPFRPSPSSLLKVDRYILTASGEGRTSAIHSLSQLVAERGGNFIELNCQISSGQLNIVAEIEFAPDVALDQLQIDLQHLAGLGTLRVRLQHQRLFTATNEIAFRRIGS